MSILTNPFSATSSVKISYSPSPSTISADTYQVPKASISTNYITYQKLLTGVWIPEKSMKTKIFLVTHLMAKTELNHLDL